MINNEQLFTKSSLKGCFYAFIKQCFLTLNPNTKFLNNWHLELLAEALEEVRKQRLPRLIINMPPRYLKSICVNVAWPAWVLGHTPSSRVMSASYAQSLATKHARDCRIILQSSWYQTMFPDTILAPDQNQKHKFTTTHHGMRFATSIGGAATGEGGDILIVDDPIKPHDVTSALRRREVQQWFEQTFMSRLNDKKTGSVVLVMQRLHEEDLTGYLLKKLHHPWHVISLPAIAPKKQHYQIGDVQRIIPSGRVLHDSREGQVELDRMRLELGSAGFAAQYMQSPLCEQGTLMHRNWIKRYHTPPTCTHVFLSWDTAIKATSEHDYSVCICFGMVDNHYYVLDLWRRQVEYPELSRMCMQMAEKWRPTLVLIEDHASGQALIQEMRRTMAAPIKPMRPKGDKVTRFASISGFFESGHVWLPHHATWLADYESELLSFPQGTHDDQVDATSQFFTYIRSGAIKRFGVRSL